MAINVTKGQCPISKNLKYPVMYLCTKFHAFISRAQFYHNFAYINLLKLRTNQQINLVQR